MADEEVKNTPLGGDDYESKNRPIASSRTESSTSLSFTGPRAQYKDVDCSFDTSEDPRFYKPIPEYEGYHRWDPEFEWTEEEEKKVVRKVTSPSLPLHLFQYLNISHNYSSD